MTITIKKEEFNEFQAICKYNELGASFHGSSECFSTCRNVLNIPEGESWGKCTYNKCPILNKKGDKQNG